MQYFQAVQIGKQRASKSQMKLFEIGGFAMLTLTTKKIQEKFLPVGEKDFGAIIQTSDGYVTILVDEEGYTKAQTKALEKEEAKKIFDKLKESGIPEYNDEIKIWSQKFPPVQNEL